MYSRRSARKPIERSKPRLIPAQMWMLTVLVITCSYAPAAQAATTQTSATLQASITSLATEIVADAAIAHDGGLAQELSAPVLTILSSPQFDWNEVLFGTNTLSATETQTASSLTPKLDQLFTQQVTTNTQAVSLINSVITSMQAINPAVQPADVVTYLNSIVSGGPTEMLTLVGLTPLNAQTLAANLHQAFVIYLGGASSAIQSLFGPIASASGSGTSGSGATSGGSGTSGSGATTGAASGSSGASTGGGGSSVQGSTTGAASGGSGTSGSGVTTGASAAGAGTLFQQQLTTMGGNWQLQLSGYGTLNVTAPAGTFANGGTLTVAAYTLPGSVSLPVKTHTLTSLALQFPRTTVGKSLTVTLTNSAITRDTLVYEDTAKGLMPVAGANVVPGKLSLTVHEAQDILLLTAPPYTKPSFPTRLPALKAWQRAIYVNGKPQAVVPALVHSGTTYMPVWSVMQMLRGLGVRSTWNKGVWTLVVPSATPQRLTNLSPGRGAYAIDIGPQSVLRLPGVVALDPITRDKTTYMPIASIMQVLARLSVASAWNGKVWSITTPQ